MSTKNSLLLSRQALLISDNPLLDVPIDSLTSDESFAVWSLLDYIDKKVTKRKKELRARLIDDAKDMGVEDEKGSFRVESMGGSFTRTKRERYTLVSRRVIRLLQDKGISLKDGGTFSFVPDEAKITDLVAKGLLTPEEIVSFYDVKVSYALNVNKPDAVKEAIGVDDGGTKTKRRAVTGGEKEEKD